MPPVVPSPQITNLTLYSDMKTLIPLILGSYLYQVGGADHYDILYQDRDKCPEGVKPLIYWNSLQITPYGTLNTTVYTTQIAFNVGLKYNPNNKGHLGFEDMVSTLIDQWNPDNQTDRRYSFTFKAGVYNNATLPDIGIFNPLPGGSIDFYDTDCKCYTFEFPVTFQLRFPVTFDHDYVYRS